MRLYVVISLFCIHFNGFPGNVFSDFICMCTVMVVYQVPAWSFVNESPGNVRTCTVVRMCRIFVRSLVNESADNICMCTALMMCRLFYPVNVSEFPGNMYVHCLIMIHVHRSNNVAAFSVRSTSMNFQVICMCTV